MENIWDEVMNKLPNMKQLIENKIAEEVGKKQVEIDALRADNDSLQTQIADLQIALAQIMGV